MRPAEQTIQCWAWDYISSVDLGVKLSPPEAPSIWEVDAPIRRLSKPGRPSSLMVVERSPKSPRGLSDPEPRARLLHTFLHHELQAAELMLWAILAFPEAPEEFRRGLLHIAHDEIRHMQMYREHIESLGFTFGSFPVRDWFWSRVPACETPTQFVAVMGMGFEAANLEHAPLFANRFRAAGDEAGAVVQERVAAEEIAHVRFATRWFQTFSGELNFDVWARQLPEPLSPMLMKGKSLERKAREQAGMNATFLDELERWKPAGPGF